MGSGLPSTSDLPSFVNQNGVISPPSFCVSASNEPTVFDLDGNGNGHVHVHMNADTNGQNVQFDDLMKTFVAKFSPNGNAFGNRRVPPMGDEDVMYQKKRASIMLIN